MFKPLFGMNHGAFSNGTVAAVMGQVDGFRGYNAPSAGVPAVWPGNGAGPIPNGIRKPFISIRPDITSFNTGALDAQISSYMKLCPPGSFLSLWAEGEAQRYPWTPEQIVTMHERALWLKFNANPAIWYGQIAETYAANHRADFASYICPGLDYYALDVYPEAAGQPIATTAAKALDAMTGLDSPRIGITEFDPRGASAKFPDDPSAFSDAWKFAQSEGMFVFMTYMVEPYTTTDLAALKTINHDAQTG